MGGIIRDATALALALRHRARPGVRRVDDEGIELGRTSEGRPIVLPSPSDSAASHHLLVLGASGAGKSLMVAHALAREWIELADRSSAEALVVVDPKGDLAAAMIAEVAALAPERLGHVHLLDPFGPGFPLNLRLVPLGRTPVEIRAVQLAEIVGIASTSRGSQAHLGQGPRQVDALTHLLLGALDCELEGASPIWAIDALALRDGCTRLARATRSERARTFLVNANLGEELRTSTLSRLRAALAATPGLERMIGAPSAIDFAALTAPGKLTIVDLGSPPGGMISLTSFMATLVVRLVLDHLLDRPSPWGGHHVRVAIDEAQIVVPVLHDVLERVLTTGRSRGISVALLTQSLGPITRDAPELLGIALTNAPLKLVGRLSAQDAERFAREMGAEPGVEMSVGELRSAIASTIANLPNRVFVALTPGGRARFESTPVDLPIRALALDRYADAIAEVRVRHALPADTPIIRLPEHPPRPRQPRARPPRTGFG